jgi:hypothetical protein
MLCSLVGGYQCFRGTYHLHLQYTNESSQDVGKKRRAANGEEEKERPLWRNLEQGTFKEDPKKGLFEVPFSGPV